MKETLLDLPNNLLDHSMHSYIEKWDPEPKAIQILEVLDYCVNGSLAGGFVVATLEALLNSSIKKENITYEDLVKLAIWRK